MHCRMLQFCSLWIHIPQHPDGGEEDPHQGSLLQTQDLDKGQESQVPSKVRRISRGQVGQVSDHPVPCDYGVRHEEDWGDQHVGVPRRRQGHQAQDQGSCEAALRREVRQSQHLDPPRWETRIGQ